MQKASAYASAFWFMRFLVCRFVVPRQAIDKHWRQTMATSIGCLFIE
jgi:hypothetical protein